ncbi:hypothetical protein [Terrihalobacillus insolitus]|nr:hypothetical protein [Terrihalobacillus insolitus]
MKRENELLGELETYTLLNPDFGVDPKTIFQTERDDRLQKGETL